MCQRPQCGQPIHPERLLDNPCVEFCVSCQQGFERAVLRSHTHQTNLSYQY
jgi:RNA polymerase-binding transcription factor DksA